MKGALLAGLLWGAFMGIWGTVTEGDPTFSIPSALLFGVLMFGPGIVWLNRRGVRRWDAAHPPNEAAHASQP